MTFRISSNLGRWSAGALLAFMLIGGLTFFGLQDNSHRLLPTRLFGEMRLMSFTGSPALQRVVRRKIHAEPPILPALPATAYSFVVTKKIVPPPSPSVDKTVLSTPHSIVPMTSGTATAETDSQNNLAEERRPHSASLSFDGPWQKPTLISRLMHEADASPPFASASAPIPEAASPSASPPREAAFVSAVLDRVTVSSHIVPASTWTASSDLPSGDRLQEGDTTTTISTSRSVADSKQTPSLPYSLQLSSCRTLENARNAAADFRKRGLDPFIVNVYLKHHGGSWWRVLSGQYSSVEEALHAKNALKLPDAIVKRTRFANLIREYETRELTIEMKNRLEGLGISAYMVEYANHGYRVFVGAFTRKSQAEKQALELQTKGIMCRVVAR